MGSPHLTLRQTTQVCYMLANFSYQRYDECCPAARLQIMLSSLEAGGIFNIQTTGYFNSYRKKCSILCFTVCCDFQESNPSVKWDCTVPHLAALLYTCVNKNPSAWNFLSPKPEVTCGTVAIIIRVVLLSPYLRIRAVSLSSIHYNQSHRVCINRRRQYICLIWN